MAVVEIWTYSGEVGKVTEYSDELGASWLVMDTGPWIVGKKVLLSAGTIEQVDALESRVHVNRTRDEIKAAPEHDPSGYRDQEYRLALAEYYSRSS